MKGRLTVKNGKYYAVISYKDEDGSYKNKWVATGLDEKNNKRAAQDMLREIVGAFKDERSIGMSRVVVVEEKNQEESPLFCDYISDWLEMAKPNISVATYSTYARHVKTISQYFREKGIRLADLKPVDIQNYYKWMQDNGKTIQECEHHHVNIRRALHIAFRAGLIQANPADRVERPKSPKYSAKYYSLEQLRTLFGVLRGDKYELLYKMTALYGLRRSEVLGLKWSAINFKENTIAISHSLVQTNYKGKLMIVEKDKMKNQSSRRTLPLLPFVKEDLLAEKERQEQNRALYKSSYLTKYNDYVWVDELGERARPQTVSEHFKTVLIRNRLPYIRFHELRHSCASLLIACGVSMKEVQEWLGHSTYATTADIYSHLNFQSKLNIAGVLSDVFGGNAIDVSPKEKDVSNKDLQKIFWTTSRVEKAEEVRSEWEFVTEERVESDSIIPAEDFNRLDDAEDLQDIKSNMDRLGFESVAEYLDYLEFKEQRKAKDKDFEM